MKVNTFKEFLNEVKVSRLASTKGDAIINQVDKALKGNIFYRVPLGKKIFLKQGGKRLTAAEKWNKNYWVLAYNPGYQDLGDSIQFEYEYKIFTVEKKLIETLDKDDYLEFRIGGLFTRIHNNQSSDWDHSAEASAAGVPSHVSKDNVSPYTDAGFIAYFAKKYKIDIKKHMHDNHYTYGYDQFLKDAANYPYKK